MTQLLYPRILEGRRRRAARDMQRFLDLEADMQFAVAVAPIPAPPAVRFLPSRPLAAAGAEPAAAPPTVTVSDVGRCMLMTVRVDPHDMVTVELCALRHAIAEFAHWETRLRSTDGYLRLPVRFDKDATWRMSEHDPTGCRRRDLAKELILRNRNGSTHRWEPRP